jgi:Fic family protein
MILKRRRLATRALPPVSLVLATQSHDYVAALQSTRYVGPADSQAARQSTNEWVELFAVACSQAVADAEGFEQRVEDLVAVWRERLGPVRSDSSAMILLDYLPATPLVTARSVERMLGVSFNAANSAIETLTQARILTKTKAGRRNRAFEARELIDAFTDLERQLASPDDDTRISEPKRSVPARLSRR